MRVEPPTSSTSSIFSGASAGVAQRALDRGAHAIEQRRPRLLGLVAREGELDVARAAAEREIRAAPRPPLSASESRFLASSQASRRRAQARGSRAQVAAVRRRPRGEPLAERVVEVLAAEARVAGGRLDLDHALDDLQHRHVEGAAAEIEHHGAHLAVPLVQPVRERRRGRLVDDPLDLEAGDRARVARRLPLDIAEVGGHGDHRLVDGQPSAASASRFRLRSTSAESSGGESLRAEVDDAVGPHVALERQRRARRVRGRAGAGRGADEHGAVVGAHRARRERRPGRWAARRASRRTATSENVVPDRSRRYGGVRDAERAAEVVAREEDASSERLRARGIAHDRVAAKHDVLVVAVVVDRAAVAARSDLVLAGVHRRAHRRIVVVGVVPDRVVVHEQAVVDVEPREQAAHRARIAGGIPGNVLPTIQTSPLLPWT